MDKGKTGDYISLHEAARAYGYTRDHLGYLIRKGDLKGERLGSLFSSSKNSHSSSRNTNPYFTTRKWIEDYLSKSGKARKKIKVHHIKTKLLKKEPTNVIKREDIFNSIKIELTPLINDIINVFKRFAVIAQSVKRLITKYFLIFSRLKIILKNLSLFYRGELKYWIKKIRRFLDIVFNLSATFLRKIISNTILLPTILLEKYYFLTNLTRKNVYSYGRKVEVLFRRTIRNILWSFSKHTIKVNIVATKSLIKLKKLKIYGVGVMITGILILLIGSNSLMLNFKNEISSTLIISLDKTSSVVYKTYNVFVKDEPLNKKIQNILPNHQIVFKEIRVGYRRTKNPTLIKVNTDYLARLILSIGKKLNSPTPKIKKSFASLNDESEINRFLNKLQQARGILVKKINKTTLITQNTTNAIYKKISNFISDNRLVLIEKIKIASQQINNWQNKNNVTLARAENNLMIIGANQIDIIKKQTGNRLASLGDVVRFFTKPFRKVKNFLVFGGTNNKKINTRGLEERISRLELRIESSRQIARQNQEKVMLNGSNGIVVVPSVGDNQENKEKISAMFSDEVKVKQNKDGKTGIIMPVFRKKTDQEYFYILVPIGNK